MRFLSIDFLNTFLLTYRVFTDSETVLNALQNVFFNPPVDEDDDLEDNDATTADDDLTMADQPSAYLDIPGAGGDGLPFTPRRTSGASSVSGYFSEGPDRDRSHSTDSNASKFLPRFHKHRLLAHASSPLHHVPQFNHTHQQDTVNEEELPPWTTQSLIGDTAIEAISITVASSTDSSDVVTSAVETVPTSCNGHLTILSESIVAEPDIPHLQASEHHHLAIPRTATVPTVSTSNSMDTLTSSTLSGPSSPSNLSSVTLVGSTGDCAERDSPVTRQEHPYGTVPRGPVPERVPPPVPIRARPPPPVPLRLTPPMVPTTKAPAVQKPDDPVITYALPPMVTTTHYTETANGELKGMPSCLATYMNGGSGGRRKSSAASMKSGVSYMTDNSTSRRPSAETMLMGIPHAALSAHRHSLQSADGASESSGASLLRMGRVGSDKSSPRLGHRGSKSTPEKIRKALFGSSCKEPRYGKDSMDWFFT